ncbi:MAG: hypothetical protein XD93_0863 [candidate division WS6 bacterium 34_10]|uniref:Uncharacterized protein n=1 Tax=candidate division WS6 bacterium 34_10 TaxID=1641389 RepID=A0A117LZS6_9BACT|nr:MAG: hypothetical protein XD93_0863 [candidate division WS6 bacterium 34_10]
MEKQKKISIYIAGDCVDSLNDNILTIPGIGGSTIIPVNGYWLDDDTNLIEEDSYIIQVIANENLVRKVLYKIPLVVDDQDCVLVTIEDVDSLLIKLNKLL